MTKSGASRFAPLLIVLAGSCWGIIGLFSRPLAAAGCSAIQTAFFRCGIATVLVWAYLLIFDREKLKIQLRDIWMFIGTGIFSLVLLSLLYFTTIELTGLSLGASLLYTSPCFVMLMSAIFFKEKITRRKLLALCLAFLGCLFTTGLIKSIFSGSLGNLPAIGILTGVGSGFCYALYSIFGNFALKKYHSTTITAYTLLMAAIAVLPFCLTRDFAALLSDPQVLKSAVGIAVFSTVMPYFFFTLGLKYVEPGRASIIAFSEPVTATIMGILVFGEPLGITAVVGIALIFVSIIFLSTGSKKPETINPTP